MSKNPAFLFYPNDWNRDMEEYPLEIQGAWIVLLCKLWWSETRGEATKSLSEWARILREKNKKTKEILEFFQKKNISNIIFLDNQSSNQNITIISRRMVKDNRISELRRQVGKLGGNPGLLKIKENSENLVNQTNNQNNQSPVPVPITVTNKEINKEKYGEFENVFLSDDEIKKLEEKHGEHGKTDRIEKLSSYIASKGKKYKSHYATILTWDRKNNPTPTVVPKKQQTVEDMYSND
uniref:DUF1376 domain-containing protein n=1 Tax=viral metagenome TaxID=1070528 RepID=A0A6H1ZHD1_9ZZZZ